MNLKEFDALVTQLREAIVKQNATEERANNLGSVYICLQTSHDYIAHINQRDYLYTKPIKADESIVDAVRDLQQDVKNIGSALFKLQMAMKGILKNIDVEP